jgi:hypothetical protein
VRPEDPRVLALASALAALLTPKATPAADQLLPLPEAARIAATSVRVLREAIRRGDLPAFGGQRDRAVRSDDLARWIKARRIVVAGADDADIARRMRRLRVVGGRRA